MDFIRWSSLISDVVEEAADAIGMWFSSRGVCRANKLQMQDVLKITKQVTRTALSATQSRKFVPRKRQMNELIRRAVFVARRAGSAR